ncbi:bis-aminopropyl spermidine synthase family protein [Mesorhizobium amorphae]|uniref:bis-aminopropyl spermidine synthase family protein n=1 Tax=Mesorhizobium amorphae TaxID=71433 RepID=UPI001780250C|nr:bis-aminopropyl spermidine synthase family protein [Mesorhizobium amorphae]
MRRQVDLQEAVNAVSDVVQNRPRPIRDFDQIHMKVGDMVMQSEIVADWADGKRLAFIGDGDAISVCTAYLRTREVLDFGPTRITVFDFDERTVQSVKRFADKERIEHLDAQLYNVLDPFPDTTQFDCFYTNPPWGASNQGESVNVFVDRGIEAIRGTGEGMIVIADDDNRDWPKIVLANVQRHANRQGFFVSRMQRKLHQYHLDDDPDLRSCNLFVTSLPENPALSVPSKPIAAERLTNFYGMAQPPKVRYVRERKKPDYGKAPDEEYFVEYLDGENP